MSTKIMSELLYDGQIARITLNSPKANVLDSIMMGEMQAELDGLRDNSSVKLIEFCSTGDHFSFGASVAEHTREQCDAMLTQFHALFISLADLGIPTAAVVRGKCLGGAMELAAMCNFIFCDQTAEFAQPEIVLGVFPPPASLILPLRVGQAFADEVILTGRGMGADEAFRRSFVQAIFASKDELQSGVEAWIQTHILPKSASSLRFAMRAARGEFNRILRTRLPELQAKYVGELMATHDANEGIQSFLEKRSAMWRNC
ncbi:enoyl-CoA hydratase/isomerase family protein [bacterium]|nr:enoyl-CoA hydratase/isomerase family protein [bacterium]